MIEVEKLSFSYPTGSRPALVDVSFAVRPAELCAVVGGDGAGKSTLAGVVSGTVPHLTGGDVEGSVRVNGRTLADAPLSGLVGEVGLVMQNPFNQISGARFSVREELAFGLENLGVPRDEMAERVDTVMRELGLAKVRDRSPYELSGGQQQLLAIGSVLVMRPGVMVLDEPTSQLDSAGCDLVFAALDTLKEQGITTLLIEHRMERLAREADRVLVLEHGTIVADGTPGEVLADERLEKWGVAPLRYTVAARRAAARQLWPAGRPLPVTLDAAVEGFGGTVESFDGGGPR
ncbi:ABC transporter ATP-binding protein [Streptomyces sp. SL13]|uniref:ABC transporter ATP-binding protein n=1 Tax=Streptantibioticus silvisoli TaxID=2705255 RepID=A0AA90H1Q2_9ACTN|nr:ABC transporter ATP-binding protein [Streptantibioticus silvisoli]MDI5968552.1 ABC transporter ATP-binding protein [Streptantibioticus silvisoli]